MSAPVILHQSKSPFGRYALQAHEEFGFALVVESIENAGKDSFWLPVTQGEGDIMAYLRFDNAALCLGQGWSPDHPYFKDQYTFLLAEVRPSFCPIQPLSGGCKRLSAPRRGGFSMWISRFAYLLLGRS